MNSVVARWSSGLRSRLSRIADNTMDRFYLTDTGQHDDLNSRREDGREGRNEREREGGMDGGRQAGREGGREGRKEGGR